MRNLVMNGRQVRGSASLFEVWPDFCVSFHAREVGGRRWRK